MPHTIPDNSMDTIDSRDIIARINELENNATPCPTCSGNGFHEPMPGDNEPEVRCLDCGGTGEVSALDEDEADELVTLRALQDDAEGASDWKHGATLIRDSYFENYAQELAEELGVMEHNATWPYTCIDWEKAAEELQQDYTSVEFGDVTYWVRS